MDIREYQSQARKTAVYPGNYSIIYPCLGMLGEAGEAADIIKKAIRDNGTVHAMTGDQRNRLRKEIGDVLWYLASLSEDLGWSLDVIAAENLAKLRDRQQRGVLHGSGDER